MKNIWMQLKTCYFNKNSILSPNFIEIEEKIKQLIVFELEDFYEKSNKANILLFKKKLNKTIKYKINFILFNYN